MQPIKSHSPRGKSVEVPTYDQLLWPTLKALKALGGSGSNQEIFDKMIELEAIPEPIQEVLLPGHMIPLLEYRAGWARTYLKKYGAIANSARGVWALLPKGERLNEKEVDRIAGAVKTMVVQSRPQKASRSKADDNEAKEPDETWKEELLKVLQAMKPDAFERLCQRVLRESGFINVEITGRTNDGGIDGVGILRITLVSFHVHFQCKRYKGSVGSPAIRAFKGAITGRGDKGLFITTGTFTRDARKEANRDGASPIDLIDGDYLCELLKKLRLGVVTEQIERVQIEAEWFKGV